MTFDSRGLVTVIAGAYTYFKPKGITDRFSAAIDFWFWGDEELHTALWDAYMSIPRFDGTKNTPYNFYGHTVAQLVISLPARAGRRRRPNYFADWWSGDDDEPRIRDGRDFTFLCR